MSAPHLCRGRRLDVPRWQSVICRGCGGSKPPPYGLAVILKWTRRIFVGEGFPLPLVCRGLRLPSLCERVKFDTQTLRAIRESPLRGSANFKMGAPHLCRGRRPRRPALAICNLSRIHLIHRYAVPLPPLGKAKLCDNFKMCALSFASLREGGGPLAVEGVHAK